MAYYGSDEWDNSPRRPKAQHHHSSSNYYLQPDPNGPFQRNGGGLHRTRSQGHAPQPIVNVFNDVHQDANLRADSHSPPYPPAPMPGQFPQPIPVPMYQPPQALPVYQQPAAMPVYPPSPDMRGRRLGEELIANELHEMRLDNRYRSRSRGRSSAGSTERGDYYKWEMERLERERRDQETRDVYKKEEARIRTEMEIKRLKEQAKQDEEEDARDAERKQIIADYERKTREAAEKAKADEIRILEKAERDRRIAAEKAKAEEIRILEKVERDKREAKEKEKREWEDFERRRKEKEEKEKREAKEEQEKLDDAMRKRLMESGFNYTQIEAIMDKERGKRRGSSNGNNKTTTTTTTTRAMETWRTNQPVYAKIHTKYLSIETLRYYEIPYKYDELDPAFIIVLREMSQHETDILFEHTRSLRAGRLLLEAPGQKPDYAWYRKRERSKSRAREGEWKKFGILEYKR